MRSEFGNQVWQRTRLERRDLWRTKLGRGCSAAGSVNTVKKPKIMTLLASRSLVQDAAGVAG